MAHSSRWKVVLEVDADGVADLRSKNRSDVSQPDRLLLLCGEGVIGVLEVQRLEIGRQLGGGQVVTGNKPRGGASSV